MTASIWNPTALVIGVLTNTSDPAQGDALLGVKLEATGAVGRTQHEKNAESISILDFDGVDPTGVSDSTTAFNTCFSSVADGTAVKFRGIFKIGQVLINGKNLTLDCMGATFNLTGDKAGFLVYGTVTQFDVLGGIYVGDGTARTGASGNGQICLSFGNESAAQVSNVRVYGAHMSNAGQGIRFSDGRGGGGTKTINCHAFGCTAINMLNVDLSDGGMGYGFLAAQADGSGFTNCVADTCKRHGFYFSEGKNYTGTGLITLNCGRGTGVRGSVSISRSANVTINGLICEANQDVALSIDTDSQGLAPDNILDGVVINGFVAFDNDLGDVIIGTSDPSADGVPKNVTIRGRTRAATAFSAASSVVIHCGQRIKIDLEIDGSASAASYRAITLDASDGASYTNEIEIYGSIDSAGYGIQVASSLQTGTARMVFRPSRLTCTIAEFDFVGGEDATTNNNLFYWKNNRKASRSYTSSGTNVVIPIGGLDVLILTAGAATTVANFSGGTEGQELLCYFGNGNTTIKNTNIYTAGAADFVGSSADTLTLVYISAAWREKCRSVN